MQYDETVIANGIPLSRVIIFDTIDSTNRYGKEVAADGAVLVIARKQTAGYGRRGSRWFATPDASLVFSLVIPESNLRGDTLLSLYSGYTLIKALETKTTAPLLLRYPNDIVTGGKKLAGILIETVIGRNGGCERIVIGVGINWTQVPAEGTIADAAAAFADIGAADDNPSAMLNTFLRLFFGHTAYLSAERALFLELLRPYNALYGKDITFRLGGDVVSGRACEIAERGLVVETCDGMLIAGEAEMVREAAE